MLDCSVTMAWVFPDEASEATDRLRESMIRGGVRSSRPCSRSKWATCSFTATRRGRIAADEWSRICASLEALPIEVDPVSMSRAWGAALALADHVQQLGRFDT